MPSSGRGHSGETDPIVAPHTEDDERLEQLRIGPSRRLPFLDCACQAAARRKPEKAAKRCWDAFHEHAPVALEHHQILRRNAFPERNTRSCGTPM